MQQKDTIKHQVYMCVLSQALCHQRPSNWVFCHTCFRRVKCSSPVSTLLLLLNVFWKLGGRYDPEHTIIMYKKMSSKGGASLVPWRQEVWFEVFLWSDKDWR